MEKMSLGKRGKGRVEHFEHEIRISVSDAHWRGAADDVSPKSAFPQQQPAFAAGFKNLRALGFGRLFGGAILDEFDAE